MPVACCARQPPAPHKSLVTADGETLNQLDQQLWAFSSTDFVPHCFHDAPAQVLENSPIVLTPTLPASAAQTILLNLGSEVPAGFEQFARIIEIVSEDALDKRQARSRWKHYAGSGCQLSSHDLQAKAQHERPHTPTTPLCAHAHRSD